MEEPKFFIRLESLIADKDEKPISEERYEQLTDDIDGLIEEKGFESVSFWKHLASDEAPTSKSLAAKFSMETELRMKTDDVIVIGWDGNKGFGQLTIKHNPDHTYTIDAELMGLDTVFQIIQATNFDQEPVGFPGNDDYKGTWTGEE